MQLHPHNNGNNNFPFSRSTTLWTVACSTIGGTIRGSYIPHPSHSVMLDVLSFSGSVAVMSYAFMSAVVGYCTKLGIDYAVAKFKNRKKK